MKVWKPVGAVAVYSKSRVAALVVAFVVLVGGVGFLGGVAATGQEDDSSPAPAQPTPAASSADQPQRPHARATDHPTGGRREAYRRGYRAGARSVFGDLGPLRAGSAYFVRAERGRGAVRIGRRERIDMGKTYWLCSGGQRLCMRPGN